MGVRRRGATRRVFDQHALEALARDVRLRAALQMCSSCAARGQGKPAFIMSVTLAGVAARNE